MAVFVNILGNAPGYDNDAQRLVRSHVMKDYRQKEREAARRKWKAAAKVMANVSCGPENSQFILLDQGTHGTGEPRRPRGRIIDSSTSSEHIFDTSQAHTYCDKPVSRSRHVSKSPTPCDKQRNFKGRDIPCTHPAVAKRSAATTAQSCKLHLANDIIDIVRSPEAFRQQLMLPFLELHYSSAMPDLRLAFPKMQARLNSSRTSILTLATDAVLLHALAVSKNDDSLLWAAQRKNNEAIAGLRISLRTSKDNASDDLLLTTDALAFFDAGSSTAWRHHAKGLAALIEAKGPRIYDTIGLLLHAPVLQLLMEALLCCGPFVFGEADWLSAMLPTCRTRMNCLLHLGCQVPDIVKRTEKYSSEDESVLATADFDCLLDSISALERSLQDWLADWYLADFQAKPPYTIAAVTEPVNTGVPAFLNPPPLPGSYIFPSLREAFGHNIFWTLLLTLRQAHYQLLATSTSTPPSALTAHRTVASEAADCILLSASFLLSGVSALPGGLACSAGPLALAGRWYALCDGEKEEERREWCKETVEVLTEGGERPAGWITRSCAAWITAVL